MTTPKHEICTRLIPIAQNSSPLRNAESSSVRQPFPFHGLQSLREGEREYDDSVNGHPSAYLLFWKILGVHQDKSNNIIQLQPSNLTSISNIAFRICIQISQILVFQVKSSMDPNKAFCLRALKVSHPFRLCKSIIYYYVRVNQY